MTAPHSLAADRKAERQDVLAVIQVPADQAIIWSKEASFDFTSPLANNYGCTSTANLGRVVWSLAGLTEGRPVGLVAAQGYQSDKVERPAVVGPIAAPTTVPTGAGATEAGTAGS